MRCIHESFSPRGTYFLVIIASGLGENSIGFAALSFELEGVLK